jgi:hypothetical protein
MARLKTNSKTYEKAFKRHAAVQSIDTNYDLGNGLIAKDYQEAITDVKTSMDDYNTQLSIVDEKLNILKEKEKTLMNWNERVLNGVASKYGKDSNEYEKAGGVRKSERKKPAPRKPKS